MDECIAKNCAVVDKVVGEITSAAGKWSVKTPTTVKRLVSHQPRQRIPGRCLHRPESRKKNYVGGDNLKWLVR